ncbi:hypothetical protein D3C72_1739610 [compost metagenome]
MGAGSDVGVIRDAGSQAGTGLHDDLVAQGDEFLHRFRRGGHAGLAGVGFAGNTYVHSALLDFWVLKSGHEADFPICRAEFIRHAAVFRRMNSPIQRIDVPFSRVCGGHRMRRWP